VISLVDAGIHAVHAEFTKPSSSFYIDVTLVS
jgi:hypothetical protein